jgi:hypothetical protein
MVDINDMEENRLYQIMIWGKSAAYVGKIVFRIGLIIYWVDGGYGGKWTDFLNCKNNGFDYKVRKLTHGEVLVVE